jgi:hypothetical protein
VTLPRQNSTFPHGSYLAMLDQVRSGKQTRASLSGSLSSTSARARRTIRVHKHSLWNSRCRLRFALQSKRPVKSRESEICQTVWVDE